MTATPTTGPPITGPPITGSPAAATVPGLPGVVDPVRWPDVARTPRAPVRAAAAGVLVRRALAAQSVRVAYPDGTVTGSEGPVLRLHRPAAFLSRVGRDGLIGFGESYQAGDWDADGLTGLLTVLAGSMAMLIPPGLQRLRRWHVARKPEAERNTPDGSRRNIHRHYDLSNELFTLFLDETMTYSAALFADPAEDLATAQRRKIDRLLDGVGAGPGSEVLEIGTGWGELAIRAAQRGARVHSVTLSHQQRMLALRRAAAAGVADRVDVRLCDYREIPQRAGGYDAIVSVEMIEAVGREFWGDYARTLAGLLAPDGRVGLQMITMAHDRMLATSDTRTWIHKYVFPGGLIPSDRAMTAEFGRVGLGVHDRLRFGQDYAETLRRWRTGFAARTAEVDALGFDATFRRTWDLYLAYSEAGFRSGYLDVCQLILGRSGFGSSDGEGVA